MSQYDKINKLTGQVRSAQVALTTAVTALQAAKHSDATLRTQQKALIAYFDAAENLIEVKKFGAANETDIAEYEAAKVQVQRYVITCM